MTHDDEPRLPSALFWLALAAGALASAVLIGWLLVAVLP
jgi:hypothetical protein